MMVSAPKKKKRGMELAHWALMILRGKACTTSVEMGYHDTVPNGQSWSRLKCTQYRGNGFVLSEDVFRPGIRDDGSSKFLLGASKWGLFYHGTTDAVYGERRPLNCTTFVTEPVVFANILTWQVGHLLVDVLEALYYQLRGRRCHLKFHVAAPEEQRVLAEKIAINKDTPFRGLLDLFTTDVATRDSVTEGTCFSEAFVDLDIKETYYTKALEFGHLADHPEPDRAALKERYTAFRTFLAEGLKLDWQQQQQRRRIVFIERTSNRRLTNLKAILVDEAEVVRLEDVDFSAQLSLFSTTGILVAQYGTGAHNVVFLPPGGVLVLLMQPGWCDYSWTFANQALLSDQHVVVQCAATHHGKRRRWAHRAARLGPWISKDADFSIDVETFRTRTMPKALQLLASREEPPQIVIFREDDEPPGHHTCPSSSSEVVSVPRVHVADLKILATTTKEAKVMLVPEVLFAFDDPLWSVFRDTDDLRLCVDADESQTCFPASVFNEFSTVDLRTSFGTKLHLKLWLADSQEIAIPRSETYIVLDVDGVFDGVGLSTITHFDTDDDKADVGPLSRPPVFAASKEAKLITFDIAVEGGPMEETTTQFCASLTDDVEMQGRVAATCRDLKLTDPQCYTLFDAALDAVETLPAVQVHPTSLRPFLFLHLEKTAGSTVRRDVVASAKRLGIPFFVPCYDADGIYREDIRCYAFDLRNASTLNGGARADLAVMAGHFQWSVTETPHCLTMVRHPVDRAISLYYERVYPRDDIGGHRLNDLADEDLRFLLEKFKGSAFGMYRDEGFCDTNCKMLLDLNLYKGKTPAQVDDDRSQNPLAFAKLMEPLDADLAVKRLNQCVVGLQDDWPGVLKAVDHWFPWLHLDQQDKKLNVGHKFETRATLHPHLRSLIEQCNSCDLIVYDAALKRHGVQERFLSHRR